MTNSRTAKIEDATWEEFSTNPEAFGFPSLERWKTEREKYLGREDDTLASADKGSTLLSKSVKRQIGRAHV